MFSALSRRVVLASLVLSAAAALTTASAQEKVVNVYNWSDYIDPQVLEDFTKETGIKVVYDIYDFNEIARDEAAGRQVRLRHRRAVRLASCSGRSGRGVFQKLDKSKLPNLKNMGPRSRSGWQPSTPATHYAVDLHVGHDRHRLQRQQGQGAPRRRADRQLGRWSSSPSTPRSSRTAASPARRRRTTARRPRSRYLGLDPTRRTPTTWQKAADVLQKCGRTSANSTRREYINALANGDICLAVGYSGDVLQARNRAERGQERRRRSATHPEGRRADVVRQLGHPGRRAEPGRRATPSSTS